MTDHNILARTIYGEARGELRKFGKKSLWAIGHVILNRLAKKTYGLSIKEVCLKPYQFSCWNKNDPNAPLINQYTILDGIFSYCEQIAHQLIAFTDFKRDDCTNGATHYHHKSIEPYWVKSGVQTLSLGNHVFYKL